MVLMPSSVSLREMGVAREAHYQVSTVEGGIEDLAAALDAAIGGRVALLVTTPTVHALYTEALLQRMARPPTCLILDCDESTKSVELVTRVCEAARDLGLPRDGVLVSVSGGVASDIVTVAASWIRRGLAHIRVPTTLIGQVDAGIGIKGAVNFQGKKSFLGCFHPPEQVLVHPPLLASLSAAHISAGLSEIVKMAVIRDRPLFALLEAHGPELLRGRFQPVDGLARWVIAQAIVLMLEELETNLFEDQGWERLVDFGHTFSPVIESRVGFSLGHGHAVAIDMALSAGLAYLHGLLPRAELDRLLAVLRSVELPTWHEVVDEALLVQGLADAAQHRGGRPNLIVPTQMGRGVCLGATRPLAPGDFEPLRDLLT